ncbi:uncharacterized protein AB675_5287 [Cyphellophora attinorum]|uniref:Uncharacterized protein n=1 Tax=Cyphellophora attinorum TaxID=1664694 RepID=A0A0N0NNX2_9EURO|nr:uncharacterized protein AB675_5287 [Phialophora attinorum]KPI41879.1 hypothetical protein AB675_5287 [Phialophora attinorum]
MAEDCMVCAGKRSENDAASSARVKLPCGHTHDVREVELANSVTLPSDKAELDTITPRKVVCPTTHCGADATCGQSLFNRFGRKITATGRTADFFFNKFMILDAMKEKITKTVKKVHSGMDPIFQYLDAPFTVISPAHVSGFCEEEVVGKFAKCEKALLQEWKYQSTVSTSFDTAALLEKLELPEALPRTLVHGMELPVRPMLFGMRLCRVMCLIRLVDVILSREDDVCVELAATLTDMIITKCCNNVTLLEKEAATALGTPAVRDRLRDASHVALEAIRFNVLRQGQQLESLGHYGAADQTTSCMEAMSSGKEMPTTFLNDNSTLSYGYQYDHNLVSKPCSNAQYGHLMLMKVGDEEKRCEECFAE